MRSPFRPVAYAEEAKCMVGLELPHSIIALDAQRHRPDLVDIQHEHFATHSSGGVWRRTGDTKPDPRTEAGDCPRPIFVLTPAIQSHGSPSAASPAKNTEHERDKLRGSVDQVWVSRRWIQQRSTRSAGSPWGQAAVRVRRLDV